MTLLRSSGAGYEETAKPAAQVAGTLGPPNLGFWVRQIAERLKIRNVKSFAAVAGFFLYLKLPFLYIPRTDRSERCCTTVSYGLHSKPERGWGGTGYTSLAGTLKDVVTATRRKHLLISEAALFQTLRARKHEQALSGGCSRLNPHVELVASPFSRPGPFGLFVPPSAQQHPLACSSVR